jgi:protein TonB
VKRDRRRSIRAWIFGGSVALHAAFAVAAVLIPKPERAETAAIELADIKKLKKEPPKPPPPPPPPPPQDKPKPPPPPPRAQAQAKAAADSPKADAPPPMAMGADGFADFGSIALGNGGGGEGVAIAAPGAGGGGGAGGAAAGGPQATATRRVVQQLAPAAADVCSDPPVRPKRKVPVSPKYTMQARQAEIEGVVRVEVTVDETGRAISARVVSGLGYGLDESALTAAKASVFEPASRCGKPIVGTIVLPFRFEST